MDMRMSSPCPLSPALSVLTLTPGRTRDIDQDMEALRLSRRDNPFLQVLTSKESLVESLFESESDDTNLMSQEISNDLEVDPFSLPEIHEHMIRSPPPTTWPRSPNYKMFRFPVQESEENLQGSSNQFVNYKKSSSKVMSSISMKEHIEEMSGLKVCNAFNWKTQSEKQSSNIGKSIEDSLDKTLSDDCKVNYKEAVYRMSLYFNANVFIISNVFVT
ncbi:conserved hypothetical protein [Pediculus humanus corporis]|uniref:Uncharacterized protein n=1 Tax=Pediculus humanus subsp. corporis TaxID=121224 RepID=E0VUH3_PEDHC|nr:uncharacterized protein Phum_PHUM450790 [Pediculus humanus corporis]EEB17029.1 conserved hypothetical protein [Pediculus humanus corporis]